MNHFKLLSMLIFTFSANIISHRLLDNTVNLQSGQIVFRIQSIPNTIESCPSLFTKSD